MKDLLYRPSPNMPFKDQIGADPVNKINIGAGEGSSIQFNSETAPSQDNLRVVLDEIRKMNSEQGR